MFIESIYVKDLCIEYTKGSETQYMGAELFQKS